MGRRNLSEDPGCGKVDPDQEKRWEAHKKECLTRFKEMQRADGEAKRIAKIPDLEGRREALAVIEHLYDKTFADSVRGFLQVAWSRMGATFKGKRGLRR